MSERHVGYLITLKRDVSADSPFARSFPNALMLMQYVGSVTPVVGEYGSHERVILERSKIEVRRLLLDLLDRLDEAELDET
jgi:hypothetical protein